MLRCPQCQAAAPGSARYCPACGFSLTDSPTFTSPPPATAPPSVRAADAQRVPGTILTGRYRMVGPLGRGGMGEVYRADDLKLGQPVALKFLPPALAEDPIALARFHNEVKIARQVSHANVCRIYDIAEADGEHFLSMEYVDGEDLASLLRRIGRLPSDKAVDIARQLCAGLASAHDAGVLHRDLKPANVMLDGRGRVKITDFGLAEATGRITPGELAGTPAYVAPEQLRNAPPTVRSDLYALGLVLYEIFTGKAAFAARSFAERERLGTDSSPPSVSSAARDVDPAVERIILQCLEPEPARRPPTALSVAASLPGSDPLAAALAAGETPSPEMVAAAGPSGALRPRVAWACFALALAGFMASTVLFERAGLLSNLPHDLPPQALRAKAREILGRIAPDRTAADSAFGFDIKEDYRDFELRHTTDDTWREKLFRGRPPAITFWYREATGHLVPGGWQRPSMNDPPLEQSGMSLVELDTSGRLVALARIPDAPLAAAATGVDWGMLFEAAGLRLEEFQGTQPVRRPPMFADALHAWEGRWPGRPDLPLRVEAASFGGAPVHFVLVGPWAAQPGSVARQTARPVDVLVMTIVMVSMAAAILLARYNVKAGRGDRPGATRLALYVLGLAALTFVFQTHHVPSVLEVVILGEVLKRHLLFAAVFWLAYLALEPYVRRRTPHLIVSWTRLLAGQYKDPLVGRDILFGACLAGFATMLGAVHPHLAWRLGQRLRPIAGLPIEGAIDAGGAVGTLATVQLVAIESGLFMMFVFVLLTIVLRQRALAIAAFMAVVYAFFFLLFEHRTTSGMVFALIPATVATIFVTRFGLLTAVAFHVFLFLREFYPPSTELSAWYGSVGLVAAFVFVALAFFGLYACLGGRPFAGLSRFSDEFDARPS